jgi:hypothetical protein
VIEEWPSGLKTNQRTVTFVVYVIINLMWGNKSHNQMILASVTLLVLISIYTQIQWSRKKIRTTNSTTWKYIGSDLTAQLIIHQGEIELWYWLGLLFFFSQFLSSCSTFVSMGPHAWSFHRCLSAFTYNINDIAQRINKHIASESKRSMALPGKS